MYAIRSYYADDVLLPAELGQGAEVDVEAPAGALPDLVADLVADGDPLDGWVGDVGEDVGVLGAAWVELRFPGRHRITSYNVCYTKLLRNKTQFVLA